jgi:carboxylesterase type B
MESGQYSYLTPGLIPSDYYFEPLLQGLNCSFGNSTEDTLKAISCLKEAPAGTVRAVVEQRELLFYPSVDNITMIAHPIKARAAGSFAKVPIIEGNVENEGTVTAFNNKNLTQYLQHDFGSVPGIADAVQAAYPRREDESDGHLISRIHSDFYFACVSTILALSIILYTNIKICRSHKLFMPTQQLRPTYQHGGTTLTLQRHQILCPLNIQTWGPSTVWMST